MTPRLIFAVKAEHFPLLFGREELARLRRVAEINESPVEAAQLLADRKSFVDTQIVISSWGVPELNADLLAGLPQLRAVFHAAGTIKNIVTDAFWDRGLRITSAACENAKPTAEFAFAQIILSLKHTWGRMFALRDRQVYEQADPLLPGGYGSTVGLLSLGKIGRLVAQRLATLDVKVIACDPLVSAPEAAQLGVQLCSLDEVFARADVVSCHTPLTPLTAGTLGRGQFARMKPGATFINTARGKLVREDELIEVLRARPDLFAVLDVTEQEPPAAASPLFRLPNVVLTPHIAGSNGPECRRLGLMMVDEVERYVRGQPLHGEVLRTQTDQLA